MATVVVGGMAWASWSSLELARKTIVEKQVRQIDEVLTTLDSHITAILFRETAREIRDYKALKTIRTVTPVATQFVEYDAGMVYVPTDLFKLGPRYPWIDLYFQIDEIVGLTSPEVEDDTLTKLLSPKLDLLGDWPHAERVFSWLKGTLSYNDVRQSVEALIAHPRLHGPTNETATPPETEYRTDRVKRFVDAQATGNKLSREFLQRKKSLRDTQLGHLPPAECEVEETIKIPGINAPTTYRSDGGEEHLAYPFVTYWLGQDHSGSSKLAFVRECQGSARIFYQGFIGDWNRLRKYLLDILVIKDFDLELNLEPVLEDQILDQESSILQMATLPVRLHVPSLSVDAGRAAAWQETRGTLITMWVVAAVVLSVAGAGLRNLVAQTERRMQFAYAVTHELRTPLTTFRLYADMLSAGLVPESSKQEYLDTLNRESLRLSSLVEDVLEYARLESHNVKLTPSDTDGATLLAVIEETLSKQCRDNGIEAKTENGMTNGRRIRTDVDLVNRIATVLVSNAVRHARGRDNASVLVRVTDEHDHVYVDVIDTGAGVARADARSIFKPFRRGQGADAAACGGIGLGLALARNWAKLLGGHLILTARNHPQYGGAHFRLTIPVELHA